MNLLSSVSVPVNNRNLSQDSSENLAMIIVREAADRKGGNIVALRVSDVSYLADYFVLVTGFSRVQVRAMSQSIIDRVEEDCQRRPLRTEGQSEGSWALLDYGDIIVHIMMPYEREFYNLEAFWGHGERIDLTNIFDESNSLKSPYASY
jgi:ribosome-associated protein